MTPLQRKSANHLVSAYNQMMQEMRGAFEKTLPGDMSLQQALNLAKRKTVYLGEVTAEEAHEIGEDIKRDISDAAEHMMESSAEFYDWLLLDIEIIERKVMDMFLSVADNTRIELEQFKQAPFLATQAITEQTPIYKSGELSKAGTLICENCGKTRLFLRNDAITNCNRCDHNRFIRRHRGSE